MNNTDLIDKSPHPASAGPATAIVPCPERAGDYPHRAPGVSRGSILIIEDEPLNRQVIARGLQMLGYRVRVAGGGEEGLASALAAEPDLLIVDRKLPGFDGLELVDRLRRQGRRTPVLMISAYDISAEDRRRVRALEIQGCLHKPFRLRHLKLMVRFTLRGNQPALGLGNLLFRETGLSLSSRRLAQKIFRTVFRGGLDTAGHVHFHVRNHSDHLILLCSRKHLGKVVTKSPECGPGECIPWDRSSFQGYRPASVLKDLGDKVNLVQIDASDYRLSWSTLPDFLCWLDMSY